MLLGLGDLDADTLEFSAPVRRQIRRPDVVVHRNAVPADDWQLVDGLPVTTPLRTVGDLASELVDQGHLAGVVVDAMTQYAVLIESLDQVLSRYARRYGAAGGESLVDRLLRQAGIPRSVLELAARADPQDWQTVIGRSGGAGVDWRLGRE